MISVAWNEGITLLQGTSAVEDYRWDFTGWLDGDTIATNSSTATGCSAAVTSATTTAVNVRVSAATPNATVTVSVVTASGRATSRTVSFLSRAL